MRDAEVVANRQRGFNVPLIAAALAIIGVVAIFAEHNKTAVQSYIDICRDDLYEIQDRFIGDGCGLQCRFTDRP